MKTPQYNLVEFAGKRFGKWTVLRPGRLVVRPNGSHKPYLVCQCECGTETEVLLANLLRGGSTSCGCTRRGRTSKDAHTTHGLSYTPEYQVWRDMVRRCYDPKSKKYPRYGGRGIKVCNRWRYNVEDFVADVGVRPSDKHKLDRLDNDGDYKPGNVHWTTNKEQALNRDTNRYLTFQGRTQTIGEWAKELGIKRTTIRMRLDVYGWTVEQALSVKPGRSGRPTDAEIAKRKAVTS